MPPLADLAPLLDVGLGGLVATGLLLIWTGRLVPSGTVDKLLAGRDERITEYKALLEEARSDGRRKDEQIGELLEVGRTSAHVLEEIRKVAAHGPGEGA